MGQKKKLEESPAEDLVKVNSPNEVDSFSVLSFDARIAQGEHVERYQQAEIENESIDASI